MSTLVGKRILLGISGGIAAYKSAQLARLLTQAGAEVRVVMTEGAQAFITPLTLQALTGHAVRTSLLDTEAEAGMGHIELARWADRIVIAPASANLMARLAHGIADDLLTTLCLATSAECLLAPAMNQAMWRHPATQRNANRLEADGWQLLGPDAGDQACGDIGPGRMLEPDTIVALMTTRNESTATSASLSGRVVTITAGPTREPLDPVRYLSNHSSGKMGFALAAAAARHGAEVHLISGPVTLPTPVGVTRHDITTAQEMSDTARQLAKESDVFIGCAAVADYRAANVATHKIKKQANRDGMTLSLVKNPDIIADVGGMTEHRPFVVGFAAETRNLEHHARDKLERKGLDMIVANDVSLEGLGFGADQNAALILWRPDATTPLQRRELPARDKAALAETIIGLIIERLMTSNDSKQTP
ncbi:bifunctional phosphopantothenoylcysteine decarboxylase/phosphopantothenate--cysteine ligase CoaBC [Aidingimonas halophila]|uniref:Coenzyme A biosynthesis bifunctional protein CoaBC n=1 Tax=Aidingimonas halophila TaxID=574349 RepID=A0A1H2VNX0_9GAMM|nr:bifunctional phosphopantothenoylcysteine decarboxylase/phosphopantothenate--cysteine ligase CoaBC [Aidingimonas halophila]GHC24610.1 phosphopantothenoylcysteine decarboxylase [Aidingimonas halophila]SDW69970.1 phosphopantothenoylcysteine decarboxylase / phosphopantothenate--cysteine ligase [Aidingimonas halophila]